MEPASYPLVGIRACASTIFLDRFSTRPRDRRQGLAETRSTPRGLRVCTWVLLALPGFTRAHAYARYTRGMPQVFRTPKPKSWMVLFQWMLEFQRIGEPIGDFTKVLPPLERVRWASRHGFEADAVVRKFNHEQIMLFGDWILAVRRVAIRRERPDILIRLQEEVSRATFGYCDEGILGLLQPSVFLIEPHCAGPFEWPGSVAPEARAHALMRRLQHMVAFWMFEMDKKVEESLPPLAYKPAAHFARKPYHLSLNTLKRWKDKKLIRWDRVPFGKQSRWVFAEEDVRKCIERWGKSPAEIMRKTDKT